MPNEVALDGRIDAESLFRAHAAFLAGFVRRLGVAIEDVDDVVQEAFLVAHRKGGYLPGPAQPRSWLGAIAWRLAKNRRRQHARSREAPDSDGLEEFAGDGRSPAELVEVHAALARVQRALDSLDIDHRAAFVLYELEGESCPAIAEAFGVPVGTIYSRLHTARRGFMQAYGQLDVPVRQTPHTRIAASP